MTPSDLITLAIAPALSILPARMDTPAARALVVAVCLQESGLRHRRQINGPARGFPQFERIGVEGVQRHPATKELAEGVNRILLYRASEVYDAIEHNDVLAAAYARLLLWRLPAALPDGRMDYAEAWRQYLDCWRPGKPHQERWRANYNQGWDAV